MEDVSSWWLNRSLCDILNEMRACYRTRNFSNLAGLIEEAQSAANRMEAALGDAHDVKEMTEQWHKLRGEIKTLRAEKEKLKGDNESN